MTIEYQYNKDGGFWKAIGHKDNLQCTGMGGTKKEAKENLDYRIKENLFFSERAAS